MRENPTSRRPLPEYEHLAVFSRGAAPFLPKHQRSSREIPPHSRRGSLVSRRPLPRYEHPPVFPRDSLVSRRCLPERVQPAELCPSTSSLPSSRHSTLVRAAYRAADTLPKNITSPREASPFFSRFLRDPIFSPTNGASKQELRPNL